MRIVISGGLGFIGSNFISKALKKKGMTPKNTRWQDDVKKQVDNF